jgi:GDPmannose 4,6-dehydratase
LITNHYSAEDWVVSTGETKTVRELCEYVFGILGLNYMDYVTQNKKYMRSEELKYLKGDSTEIRNRLGWSPKYNFETMIHEMIDFWEKNLNENH